MKKYGFLLALAFLLSSCYVGFVAEEGNMLSRYIEPEALLTLTESPVSNIWIIDVRPAGAYENAHIPTAKSFPSSEITDRLDELPKSQYLIFYCETGGRAQSVINNLMDEGYTRMMNWGGFGRWEYETESGTVSE